MAPMTLWKHSKVSRVVQDTAGRSSQTRGAQQGDVVGSFEASAALAEQARATRAQLHQAQADGLSPWATNSTDPQHQQSRTTRMSLHPSKKLNVSPRTKRQEDLDARTERSGPLR